MNLPKRTTTPTSSAGLHWQTTDDGSRTLWNERLNETFHSGFGAVAESLIVYLQNSGIYQRLRSGQGSAVLEYGLGTATAFLLTAATAVIHRAPLRYRALELYLLPATIFKDLNFNSIDLRPLHAGEFSQVLSEAQILLSQLADWRTSLPSIVSPGVYACKFGGEIELEAIVGNALAYEADGNTKFDAIYFDPFSPANCPDLWTSTVYRTAFQSLCEGGTLTSYCVKGSVRRDLLAAGFDVFRLPGPVGGKREVMLASKPDHRTGE